MDDLETAAAQAPLAHKIRSFAAWAGPGRKLTQTGKITLSDARHLVEFLQTGDTIDPAIGDRVFRTTSSTELGGLTRIAEWAKGARLVRVTGKRLVQVKKNTALLDRPLDLVVALAGAYSSLGRSLFPRGRYPPVAGRGRVRRHRRRAAYRPDEPVGTPAARGAAGSRQ